MSYKNEMPAVQDGYQWAVSVAPMTCEAHVTVELFDDGDVDREPALVASRSAICMADVIGKEARGLGRAILSDIRRVGELEYELGVRVVLLPGKLPSH